MTTAAPTSLIPGNISNVIGSASQVIPQVQSLFGGAQVPGTATTPATTFTGINALPSDVGQTSGIATVKKPNNTGMIVGVTIAAVVLAALAITLGILLSPKNTSTSLNNYSGLTSTVAFSQVQSGPLYSDITTSQQPIPPVQPSFVVTATNRNMSIYILNQYQFTASVPVGTYNGTDLAIQLQGSLNQNNGLNKNAFTVTYDEDGRYYTITCNAFRWSFCSDRPNTIYNLMNLGLTTNETSCSYWINTWKGQPIPPYNSNGSNTSLPSSKKLSGFGSLQNSGSRRRQR